jgi:hypothetical protein
MITLPTTSSIQSVNAQADITTLISDIPFDPSLSEVCKVALLTSPGVLDAFQACGGVALLGMRDTPVSF